MLKPSWKWRVPMTVLPIYIHIICCLLTEFRQDDSAIHPTSSGFLSWYIISLFSGPVDEYSVTAIGFRKDDWLIPVDWSISLSPDQDFNGRNHSLEGDLVIDLKSSRYAKLSPENASINAEISNCSGVYLPAVSVLQGISNVHIQFPSDLPWIRCGGESGPSSLRNSSVS